MDKFLDFLIKKRYLILAFFILLAIGNIFLMKKVTINYDISSYLAKGSNTRVSLEIMNSEFETNGNFQLMVANCTKDHANEIKEEIEEVDGVKIVIFDSESESSYHDNYALFTVFLKKSNFDTTTREAVKSIKTKVSDEEYYLTGAAIESLYISDSVNEDMYKILLTAMIIVFVILIINSVSWIEPVIFMIVIGVAILINFGSNAFLPSISFVTGSICAVMQLALAMDYSIMLLHRYISEKESDSSISNYDAIKNALHKSIMPILSSGLTTIAGLMALVFMNFKIGFDIGIVLSKGIVVSLIVVLFFMPGLLMIFSSLVNKTKHRNLYQVIRQKFPTMEKKIAHYQYKSRYFTFAILAVLIIVGFVFYLKTNYIYTLEASNEKDSSINIDKRAIEDEFGVQNNAVIILPKNEGSHEEEVNNALLNYDYKGDNPFTSIQSTITTGLNKEFTAFELASEYNLPEALVDEVYASIDDRTTYKLKEVIDYLKTTTFISDYTDSMQSDFDKLYQVSLLLDEVVNSQDLSSLLTDYSGIEFSVDNASALINKVGSTLTFKEFITKIAEEKFFSNLYNDYNKYCETADNLEKEMTKEEVLKLFIISSEDLNNVFGENDKVKLKVVMQTLDSSKVDNSDKYNYYMQVLNTKDNTYTRDEVMNMEDYSYNIIPKAAYLPAFLLSNKASNYSIQKSLASLLKNRVGDAEDALTKASSLIPLVDKEMDINEVSNSFGISDAFIEPVYQAFCKDKITGKDLLKYVSDNKYIKEVGISLSDKIDEASKKLEYAIASFESENYSRIILNLKYKRSSRDAITITRNLQNDFKEYYDNYYVASECGAFADFEDTFATDSIKISIASIFFILIIIAISFRSIAVPIILTLIIQGAIWFTMAISVWTRSDVYFICYLMIVCIQMGTTIDYGILYTSKYLEERKMNDKETSIVNASRGSITTILTSGTIIVVASFIVGVISKVSIISSIGYLLSVGTIVSVSFILLALPQILIVCEKFIERTTIGHKNK